MLALSVAALLAACSIAESKCHASMPHPSVPAPSVAAGYDSRVVVNGFTNPRGILFDSEGNLLVVDRGKGIEAVTLRQEGGEFGSCIGVESKKMVVNNPDLNHGIALSKDGKTLYASSVHEVFSWDYNAAKRETTSKPKVLVRHMTTDDHTTRTLLLSEKVPGMLIVNRGSTENIDPEAMHLRSGHSQVKAFDLENMTRPYDFTKDGKLLGWGLRNDVGVAEEPVMGGIYTVENSVDEMTRNGVDIHENNPGEEMNFLGYMDPKMNSPTQGENFGYPQCFSAWDPTVVPHNKGLEVGMQFAIGGPHAQKKDAFCQNDRIAPTLVFQAHMAPLDIKFNDKGSEAWITFHGSWDRTHPTGYKVSAVQFAGGKPVELSNSTKAAVDIVSNQDNSKCPEQCFRPVGLAWDPQGRLFFSSDETGEVYVISRSKGSVNGAEPSSSDGSATPGQSGGTSSANNHNAAPSLDVRSSIIFLTTIAIGIAVYVV